jgi:hypothetical protein
MIVAFNDFCEKMDQLEIRLDSETIRRLFNSLTLEKKTGSCKIQTNFQINNINHSSKYFTLKIL